MKGGHGGNSRRSAAVARVRRNVVRAVRAIAGIFPSRASGAVDVASEPFAGSTTVLGWAHRRWDPVEVVLVLVDGSPAELATFGFPRPDLGTLWPGAETGGWSARVELHGAPGRQVSIGAVALTRAGLVERLNDITLEVPARDTLGRLVRPGWDSVVPPTVIAVEGWTLSPSPPARVEVRIDDQAAGLARPLAIPLPEAASTSTLPWAPLAGFTHTVDLSAYRTGDRVRIGADVVTLDGMRTPVRSVDVTIAPARRPSRSASPPKLSSGAGDGVATVRRANAQPTVRLLVVTHQLDLGGGQLYMLELLRHLLLELDVSCLVVSTTDGVLRGTLEDLGAFVHVCGRPSAASPRDYEALIRDVVALVKAHECNVAFVNTMSAAFGADLASRLDMPAVWAIHESYPLEEFFLAAYGEGGVHPYVRDLTKRALGETAALIFEADATRELYEPLGDPRRFLTVPYGIRLDDVDEYLGRCDRAELRRAHGFLDHETVLLCMGTYEPRKGQGALALAFAQLTTEFPDAVLALVGDIGSPYATAVREVVRRLDLDDRICLVPVVEDTYAWYAMADIFVTVSDVESLPRSVLEAMAFGVPVLAASVFGLAELLEDAVTALLFAPRDVRAMVEALRRIMRSTAEERAVLAQRGSKFIRAHFDSAGYAGVYRQLLRGLLDDPQAFPEDLLAP